MKKKLRNILIVLILITAVIWKFTYIDIKNSCVIKIVPSIMPANAELKKSIKQIRQVSPNDYTDLCVYVKTIDLNPGCGGLDGGCFYEDKTSTIFVGNDQGSIANLSSIIIHEVCHVKQKVNGTGMSENECYRKSNDYLNSITVY